MLLSLQWTYICNFMTKIILYFGVSYVILHLTMPIVKSYFISGESELPATLSFASKSPRFDNLNIRN
jgi:hypothetical protein